MGNTLSPAPETQELIRVIEKLERTIQSSTVPVWQQMLRNFLTGMASSIGALVALAIVVPFLLYLLRNIEWVPMVGTFVEKIMQHIQHSSPVAK